MPKIYFLLISLLALGTACSSSEKETTSAASASAEAKTQESSQNKGISPLKTLLPTDAPQYITYKGKPTAVYQFTDIEGEHLIVVSETGEMTAASKGEDMKDMEMAVYHLLSKESKYSEVWKAQDNVKDCMFDLVLNIRPESMEITDLDKDGIAEISFVYYIACISDVSPYQMKLLMYEGANKYALRGSAKVMDIKSKYTPDAAMSAAPAEFLDFAKKKWGLFEDQAAG